MSNRLNRETVAVPLVKALLDEHGYAVVPRVGGIEATLELLAELGELIPQYDGMLAHEVRHRPGNETRAYSQSTNTIRAHTEAPGWQPSPAWLALYCHRQARCGGGQTDLLDIQHVLPELTRGERALLRWPMWFPAPATSGGDGVRTAPLTRDGDRDVLRFSYNLLSAASYDPELGAAIETARLPLGAAGAALAEKINRSFERLRSSILIPEGAVLVWDNQRMLHARSSYADQARHLTRYWIQRRTGA
jgi:hypothetical protein